MKSYRTPLLLFLSSTALCIAARAEEFPLKLKLSVSPRTVPISIPVEMYLNIRNDSSSTVTLPNLVAARLTGSNEVRIVVTPFSDIFTKIDEVAIGPKQELQIGLPVSATLDGNSFLPYVLQPGDYRIDLLFFSERAVNMTDRPFNPQLDPIGAKATASAEFSIAEPSGEDEVVWDEIMKLSRGHTFHAIPMDDKIKLATWVWDNHPTSQYAPFVVLHRRYANPEERIAHIEEAVSRLASTPQLRDQLALKLGKALKVVAGNLHDDHPAKALAMFQKADSIFLNLSKSASLSICAAAKEELAASKD